MARARVTRRVTQAPSLVLGIGFGGFVDGIVLHQILQWHHMISDTEEDPSTLGGLEANTLADGLFHTACWLFLMAGTVMAVRAWQRGELAPPWRTHIGALLAGWGIFNLFDGVVDHHLLGIHHVRDDLGGPLSWDIGYLVFAVALIVGGRALARSGERTAGS